MALERSCSLTAVALSGQRREGVRLVTGVNRHFSLSSALDFVYVPYPLADDDWTRTTVTCGVAMQCSPSKERVLGYRLDKLSARELTALTVIESRVSMGWITSNWPGLTPELAARHRSTRNLAGRPERRRNAQPRNSISADQGVPGSPSTDGQVANKRTRHHSMSPTSCVAHWAECRGRQTRSVSQERIPCPLAVMGECATRTCPLQVGHTRTISTSLLSIDQVSHTRSGTRGIPPSYPIMLL